MCDEKVDLLRVTPKTDHEEASDPGGKPNLDVFVKRRPVKLPPIDNTDTINGAVVHTNVINDDAWEEEAVLQSHLRKGRLGLSRDVLNKYPLSEDDKKIAISRTMRIWRTLFHFFSTTSFHALPHIAGSKRSHYRITYWFIAMLLALGLMLWAVISVTMIYTDNNAVLISKQQFNERLLFPAITICNLNLYRRSVFSSTGVELDQLVVYLNFLSGNVFLAENFDFDSFFTNYWYLFSENSVFLYNNSGHQINEMLFDCRFAGVPCSASDFIQISTTSGNCYMFNSGRNRSLVYANDSGYLNGLEVILSAEEYEYFVAESDSIGFNVFIHDQDHLPYYGEVGGFSVSAGQRTQIALNKVDYKLLPSSGGCSDDVDLKYFNRYAHVPCLTECVTDIVVNKCGCKAQFMPGLADICTFSNPCWLETLEQVNITVCNCPIACTTTTYEKTLSYAKFPAGHLTGVLNRSYVAASTVPLPDFVVSTTSIEDQNGSITEIPYLNSNFSESFLSKNFLKLRIFYESLVSTTMEEHQEYSTAQFIVDFAGYIGLFTGAGFLTLFEVMELCYGMIRPADDY